VPWTGASGVDVCAQHDATDLVKIADFASYPELMWLHRHELVPASILALFSFGNRRMAGLGRRIPLEHGSRLSRDSLHRLAPARAREERYVTG
jgi:hypothetical protein